MLFGHHRDHTFKILNLTTALYTLKAKFLKFIWPRVKETTVGQSLAFSSMAFGQMS